VSRARHALALAALALLSPAAAFADPANLTELANDLQRLQLQIAQGDKAAYAAQFIQQSYAGRTSAHEHALRLVSSQNEPKSSVLKQHEGARNCFPCFPNASRN